MKSPALRTLCFALCTLLLATLPIVPSVYSQQAAPAGTSSDVQAVPPGTDGEITVVPAPGRYGEDVTIRSPGGSELELRFLHADGTPHTEFFIPIDRGVHLDSPADSEVHYRVELRNTAAATAESTIVSYLLDSLPPSPPVLRPRPGLAEEEIVVLPPEAPVVGGSASSVSEGHPFEDSYRVYYRLLDRNDDGFRELPPEGVVLTGAPGSVTEYRVAAYAVDHVGNRSDISITPYRIDRINEEPPSDRIVISPVAGDFANEQLLFLDTRGLENVRLELVRVGSDGREESLALSNGIAAPTVIPGDGSFRLRVDAASILDGTTIRREVRWSQRRTSGGIPRIQGYLSDTIELSPPSSGTRYTLDDTSVSREDPIWIEPLAVTPTPDSLRHLVVRYLQPGAPRETRLTLLPDGRRAPPPDLVRLGEGLLIYALAETEIQWRPGDGEVQYGEPAAFVPLPPGSILSWEDLRGISRIHLRSRYPGGAWTERVVPVPEFSGAVESVPAPVVRGSILEIPPTSGEVILADLHDGSPILRYRSDVPFRWDVPAGFRASILPLVAPRSVSMIADTIEDEGDTAAVLLDAAPPAPPTVAIGANRLQLRGEGSLIFRIDGGPDQPYESPVSLPGVDQALRRYRIEAYRIVDGKLSPVRRVIHTVDRRVPLVPPVEHAGQSSDTETILTNHAEFELRFANPFPDLDVHYEVAAGGRSAVPGSGSPSTRESITLETAAGEVVSYAVALRARFSGSNAWSPVRRYTVVVDRSSPEPPRLEEEQLQTDRMLVLDPPEEEDVTLWYRLSPDEPFRRYFSPVDLNDPLRSGPLRIEAFSRDRAGNQAALPETLSLSVDSEAPPVPRLTLNGRPVFDPRVTMDREVLVDLREDPGNLLMWRILPSAAEDPPSFEEYTGEVLLSRGDYTIEAYSRSTDQRQSDLLRVVLTVSDQPPDPPELPFISYNPDGRSGDALWSGRQARQLFVSVSPSDGTQGGFMPQDGVYSWVIPEGETRIAISFFTVDDAGRRSSTEIVTVDARPSSFPPRLAGAEDEGRYGESRRIELIGEGEIRYTLSTDGGPPPTVHALSPRYEVPLDLEAAPGEERIYRIRFRTFSGDRPVSEANEATIVIDRRPPAAPLIQDIADGGYYSTEQTFRLTSAAGDRIMYRVIRANTPDERFSDGGAAREPFLVYGGEAVPLTAPELQRVDYAIEAYTIDTAGNRSQGLSRWITTIDTASIHVAAAAPRSGADTAGTRVPAPDGSREAPFGDLDTALRESIATGRSSLFLTAGDYSYTPDLLADAFVRTGGLTIVGGLAPLDWTSRQEWSRMYPADETELVITGTTSLQGIRSSHLIRIADTRDDHGTPRIPTVTLDRLVSTNGTHDAIILQSGTLRLSESVVTGRISAAEETSLRIDNSNIGELSARNASVRIEGGAIAGVRLHDGAVATVTDGRIEGDGRAGLDGLVYAENSNLTLSRSIVSDAGVDVILIRGRAGHVVTEGTSFHAMGEMSAVGLRLTGGSLTLTDSVVLIDSPNYAYGLALRDGSSRISGSGISVLTGTEAAGIVAGNSSIHLSDSILRLEGVTDGAGGSPPDSSASARGTVALTGISATGSSPRSLTAVDSSIVSRGGGTAFRVGPDLAVRIDNNLFANWNSLVQRSSVAGTWNTDGRIERVEELNSASRGGGNRAGTISGAHPEASTVRLPRSGNVPPALDALRSSLELE